MKRQNELILYCKITVLLAEIHDYSCIGEIMEDANKLMDIIKEEMK